MVKLPTVVLKLDMFVFAVDKAPLKLVTLAFVFAKVLLIDPTCVVKLPTVVLKLAIFVVAVVTKPVVVDNVPLKLVTLAFVLAKLVFKVENPVFTVLLKLPKFVLVVFKSA